MNFTDNLKIALVKSKCHTNDWDNWLAQKECGVGNNETTIDIWKNLVDSWFNITYYPYIQEGDNYQCLQEVMQQSRTNLEKSDFSIVGVKVSQVLTVGIMLTYMLLL